MSALIPVDSVLTGVALLRCRSASDVSLLAMEGDQYLTSVQSAYEEDAPITVPSLC